MKAPTPGALEKKIAAMERSTWIMEQLSPSSCIGDVGDAASSDGRFVRSGWQFDMDISRNLQLISLMMTHIGNRIRVRYWSLHHFIFRTVYQFQNHVDSRWHLTSALWTKSFQKLQLLDAYFRVLWHYLILIGKVGFGWQKWRLLRVPLDFIFAS